MKHIYSILLSVLLLFNSVTTIRPVMAEEDVFNVEETNETTEVYEDLEEEVPELIGEEETDVVLESEAENTGEEETVEEDTVEVIEDTAIEELPQEEVPVNSEQDGDVLDESLNDTAVDPSAGNAYAVLTAKGELIFFRSEDVYEDKTEGAFTDILGNSYTGKIFAGIEDLVVETNPQMTNAPWTDDENSISKVSVAQGQTISPVSTAGWFRDLAPFNYESFDLNGLDTSETTHMSAMFQYVQVASLDLSMLETGNVVDMSWMFNGMENLTDLNLEGFDTANVKTMESMFKECKKLQSIDLSSFETPNLENMAEMFSHAEKLSSIDFGSFDTSKVTNMFGLFESCITLKTLDLSGFQTGELADISAMFRFCSSLESIDLSGFDTSKVESNGNLFLNCSSLNTLVLPAGLALKGTDLPKGLWVHTASDETLNANELMEQYADLSLDGEWIRQAKGDAYVILSKDGKMIFFRSENAPQVGMEGTSVTIDGKTYTGIVYDGVEGSEYTNRNDVPWYSNPYTIKSISVAKDTIIKPISMAYWFYGSNKDSFVLDFVDLDGIDSSKVTNMQRMFGYFRIGKLKVLDLSMLDTSNVTDMSWAFYNDFEIVSSWPEFELDLSGWDTSNVTNMKAMFILPGIKSLDLSHFDTSKVEDMSNMFSNCYALESLDISSFNTSNVKEMYYMFDGCRSLKSLDLSHFDTSKTRSFFYMFYDCRLLKELDLFSFDTRAAEEMHHMFGKTNSLIAVYIPSSMSKMLVKEYVNYKGETEYYYPFLGGNTSLKIYTDAASDLPGWDDRWNYTDDTTPLNVTYGISHEEYLSMPKMDYGISYVLNSDEAVNDLANISGYDAGEAFTFKAASRPGYNFAGWFNKDGSETGKWGTQIKSISKSSKGDLTLYAKWTPIKYTIKYNLNGGSNPKGVKTAYYYTDEYTLPLPTKKGYEFKGWYTDSAFTSEPVTVIPQRSSENIVFYAKFDLIKYHLTLDTKGGKLANSKQSYDARFNTLDEVIYEAEYDVTSSTFKFPTLAKDGYKFNGWYDKVSEKKVTSVAKGSVGDREIYAKFTPVTYKLTYKINGGKILVKNTKTQTFYDTKFDVNKTSLDLPVFEEVSRVGYIFDGWYRTYNSKTKEFSNKVSTISDLEYKNTTLYAKWDPIHYTIIFRSNEGLEERMVAEYGVTYKLNNDIFDQPGRAVNKFTYSYVNSKGNTVLKTIAGNAKIKNLKSEDGDVIVLNVATKTDKNTGVITEQWKNVSYTIKYSLPKGAKNGSKNPTKYAYTTDSDTYKINNPTLKNHEFLCWTYVDKKGNTQSIYPTSEGYAYLPAGIHQNLILIPVFGE